MSSPHDTTHVTSTFSFENSELMISSLGPQDIVLTRLAKHFPEATFIPRGYDVVVTADQGSIEKVTQIFKDLQLLGHNGGQATELIVDQLFSEYTHTISSAREDIESVSSASVSLRKSSNRPGKNLSSVIGSAKGKPVRPQTLGQSRYVHAIENNDIVFGIGAAGTGKTYLAVAMAVTALKVKQVERIILTRPAVEAGESLGFLPGSLNEKIDPYVQPLYDALHDMLDPMTLSRYIETGVIEVAPLAYMRGRTLNNAFIILDEAQNTTSEQMKMFLTRLGHGSQMVVTGDGSQTDLPQGKKSGLKTVESFLPQVSGIEFVYFDSHDVVRHDIVSRIVEAYHKQENSQDF